MDFIKKNGAGLLLCLCIAIPAWLLGQAVPVVGGPVFSILIGMVLTLFWKNKTKVQPGIGFTSKKVLQYAVILLGFGLNLSEIAKVGAQSLPIIVSTIGTSLIVSFVLCKAMKVPSNISTLVGVGSSICGGSAIAATAPVIGADDEEIAQAISVIFLFNVIAALTFPTLGGMLGMTDHGFGLFAGTAVNDTSSVTAAASAWDGIHGSNTLEIATIVKLTRTLAIIPITLVLALWRTHKAKTEQSRGGDHHHGVHHGRRTGRRIYAAQDAVQVLYRYGDGGYRHEYQYRKTGQDRRQADFHGLLLLGRYRVRQHRDAALARVPLSEKHKGLMSFVLFAFLLLFECIKPFGIGLFARTAPALAHLLVLLLLELQRLLRFGADADLRGLPSGFPLRPFGIVVCRLYGSLNSRTEWQSVVVPQQVNQQLRLLRLCAEGYLCRG